jgi:hypothetical protein
MRTLFSLFIVLSVLFAYGREGAVSDTLPQVAQWEQWAKTFPQNGLVYRDSVYQWNNGEEIMLRRMTLSGRMRNGVPVGGWEWADEVYVLVVKGLRGQQLDYDLPVISKKWMANFRNGLLHGRYEIVKTEGYGRNAAELMRIQGGWSNGLPHGKWTLREGEKRFEGNFEEGFMTDTWMWSNGISTSMDFYRGILLQRCVFTDTCLSPEVYFIRDSLVNLLESDSLICLSTQGFGWGKLPNDIKHELDSLLPYHQAYFMSPYFLGLDSLGAHNMLTRAVVYFMDDPLRNRLEEMQLEITGMLDETETLLGNTLIRIHRQRRPELGRKFAKLNKNKIRIDEANSLLTMLLSENVKYLGWENVIKNFLRNNDSVLPTFEDHYIDLLSDMLGDIRKNLDSTRMLIEELGPELHREMELEEKEQELLTIADSLRAMWDDAGNHPARCWVDSTLERMLGEYSRAKKISERSKILDNARVLSERWLGVELRLHDIDSIPRQLRGQYIQYAYNPYTGEYNIEIRIKRRFYQKSMDVVWPYLQRQLCEAASLEAFEEALNNHHIFRDKMRYIAGLSDWSTRRLERRFRKEDNPQKLFRYIEGQK